MTRATGTPRQAYRQALVELARSDRRIYCIDADTVGLQSTFGAEMPDRYVNVGIAEANATSVAAGLAATGIMPFFATMATFATARAAEQVKLDVAGNGLPVRIVGTHGGFAAGHLGPTHHALEDVAIMRSLPGVTIVVAGDATRVERLVPALAEVSGPAYLRLGRDEELALGGDLEDLAIGRALSLRYGDDVTIVATGGFPVAMALEAHDALADEGVRARVLEMHTIAPLDVAAIVEAAVSTAGIVTVEDHRTVGGLGSAVAETTAIHEPCSVRSIGVPLRVHDRVGGHRDLLESAGVRTDRIVDAARSLISAKARCERAPRR